MAKAVVDAGVAAVEQVQQVAQQVAEQAPPQVVQQVAQEPQLTFVWWLPFIIALVLVFAIEFARALPFKKETLAKKPFTCDACMTGWSGIAVFALQLWMLGSHTWVLALMHTLPAQGAALMLLALRSYWKPVAPMSES